MRQVGGDGWILVFQDADTAVRWALDIEERVKREFMRIGIGMTWGIPRLTKGGATDQHRLWPLR